jgi:hypothetical protein
MFAKCCVFCAQNQKVALTNQEIMKITPALLSIGSTISLVSRVEGHQSLRAPSQVFRSLLERLEPVAMPFIKKDLDNRKLGTDTLVLYDSAECLTSFEAWRSERGAAEQDCMENGNAVECSVDSKMFASHGSLVSMCKNAGRLYTYSAICDVSFDDTSSGVIAFNEIGIPECIVMPCTVDELSWTNL